MIIISLCGCSNSTGLIAVPVTRGFNCDFSIDGSELSGEISVNNEGDMSLVFTEPDIINGLGIRVKEESVIIEVQGISERYLRSDVPENSPALHLYDALCDISVDQKLKANDEAAISGKSLSGYYTATLNEAGFLTEVELSSADACFKFQNHTNIQ